jgi:predicted nucleic acid-binding protein
LILYAESSAVLAWLLTERGSDHAHDLLTTASTVATSALTLVECERGLLRAHLHGRLSDSQLARRKAQLAAAAVGWNIAPVGDEVLHRASERFPNEPVRTLDAIHLATALLARSTVPDVSVISLDHRIRTAAAALGFEVLP